MSIDDSDKMNLEDSVSSETEQITRQSLESIKPTEADRRSPHPKSDPPEIIQIPGYANIKLLSNKSERSILYLGERDKTGQRIVFKKFFEDYQDTYKQEKAIQEELREKGNLKHLLLAEQFLEEQRVMATAYAEGGDLKRLIREFEKDRIALNPYQARAIAAGACKGLECMHDCGIVYRDVKPANMVLDIPPNLDGKKITIDDLNLVTLKYIDFESGLHQDRPQHNRPGTMFGTPIYSAPELCKGRKPDQRSDIYALGVVFFQLFTGKLPFYSRDEAELMKLHAEAPVPDMAEHNPSVSKDLQYIVEKAMAKDPDDRYQTVAGLKKDYFMHLR